MRDPVIETIQSNPAYQQLRRKRAGSGAGPDAQCRAQSKRTAGNDQQPPQAQREVQKMRRGERENIAAQPPARQEQHEQHRVQRPPDPSAPRRGSRGRLRGGQEP